MSLEKEKETSLSRRRLLTLAISAAIGLDMEKLACAAQAKDQMPYRLFGRTGEKVSLVGLGGYHIGNPRDEQEGIQIIRTAIDEGINFMDNCWDYHGGHSEVRMGKALRDGYRQKVFLMTKIDGRDKKTAASQLDESLRRLQTDTIDLMQIHEVTTMSEPETIFGPGGAMEALLEAKQAGKIRYIGFTGHKSPAVHLKMLETAFSHHFTFDAVQLPLNVMDAHYSSFEKLVVPVLIRHRIAVLGMKPLGGGQILKAGVVSPIDCLQYAMSLPTSTVITGCDSMPILQQALKAARAFHPPSEQERTALLARTRVLAENGKYELYKSTALFDATRHHPRWRG